MGEHDPIDHFQDREEAIAAFDGLWDQGQHRWILNFDGFSGVGKSTLIQWLVVYRCKANNLPYCIVDFAVVGEYKALLDSIIQRRELHACISKNTLQQYQHQRDDILRLRDQNFDLIYVRQEQIGGLGNTQNVSLNLEEIKRVAENRARERLTNAWLDCMSEATCEKMVFFFDRLESFKDDASQLWSLLERVHNQLPKLRVVIGSREPSTAVKQYVERKQLAFFEQQHSDALLYSLGVTDVDFRNAVYERLALGHPLVTTFAGDAWLEAVNSGKPLNANQVPRVGQLEDAVRWIQDEILSRLEDPLKSIVRWASLLRGFNLETLKSLLDAELSEDEFKRLTTYSFVEQSFHSRMWKCHDLLHKVQSDYLSREQPQGVLDFHQRTSKYFQAAGVLAEEIYHRFYYQLDEAFGSWSDIVRRALRASDFDQAELFFGIIETTEFPLLDVQRATYLHFRGLYYFYVSEHVEAEHYYSDAIALFKHCGHQSALAHVYESFGSLEKARSNFLASREYFEVAATLYESLGESALQGRVHHSLGLLEIDQGSTSGAQIHYETALGLIGKNTDPNDYANVLGSFGNLNQIIGRPEEAEAQFVQAQALFIKTKNKAGQANVLRHLVEIRADKGELDFAKQTTTALIEFFEQISAMRDAAYSYLTLGDLYFNHSWKSSNNEQLEADLNKAPTYYLKAYEIFRSIKDTRGESLALFDLATVLMSAGRFEEAKEDMLEALSLQQQNPHRFDLVNIYMGLTQLEGLLDNEEQAKGYYALATDILELSGLRYSPTSVNLRRDFWSMTFHIREELYPLSMRILDWVFQKNKDESRKYLESIQHRLLTDDTEAAFSLMIDFGADRELLQFHLRLLQDCRNRGTELAFADVIEDIWQIP